MRNNNGFTLVEIMVAGLLVSVMTLAISSVMISNQRNYNNFQDNSAALKELGRLEYYVTKYFSQAININYRSSSIDSFNTMDNTSTNPAIGHRGLVRLYDSTTETLRTTAGSGASDNIELMAISLIENNQSALNSADSEFAAVAMYFQRPTSKSYGQVIIQKALDITGATKDLQPGVTDDKQTPSIFERIVEAQVLKVYPEGVVNNGDITSMDLRFVARSFVDAETENWNWCPTSLMGVHSSCPAISVNDHELFVTVTFRNNLVQSAPTGNIVQTQVGGTRPIGPIYFFQTNLFLKE